MQSMELFETDDIIVASFYGNLNLKVVEELKKEINGFLNNKQPVIAFNFHEVDSIDSSAIAFLVKFLKNAMSNKKEFILYSLNPIIENVFKIANLHNFFTIMKKNEFEQLYKVKVE